VLLNPIHADYEDPILWECEGEVALRDGQLKCGCVELTTVRQVELPVVTTEQRVKFGILCALEVCQEPGFVEWANKWLNGEDRTEAAAARAAAWAAVLATETANAVNAAQIDLIKVAIEATS
jgi:hypothetical protein